MPFEPIITGNVGVPNAWEIDVYESRGGYRALAKALREHQPEELVDLVSKSGLRGRGGAGFPAGRKWSLIPKGAPEVYMVCNADESEPGSFSNHELLDWDPHSLIEGVIIGSYAIRARVAFIYMRGEFWKPTGQRMEAAIAQAYARGYLGRDILGTGYNLDLHLFIGAGAYVCGEETALLESIEGNRPMPRPRPPYFPPSIGLYGKPTAVNNVETLANVPHIVLNGAEWYTRLGNPPRNPGTKVFSLSGLIKRPGNYEAPLGITLRELLFGYGGGMLDGRTFKAVTPGGTSTPLLTAEHLDVRMDYDSLPAVGTYLGSTGLIVMDDTVCIPCAVYHMSKFYQHESCGKCTPCREGTSWINAILYRITHGQGREEDMPLLLDLSDNMGGRKTVCALGDFAGFPVTSSIKYFRQEYEYHIRYGRCPTSCQPAEERQWTISQP
ncbi:MAG: NADH-quinone oxidoreductase subunit NuoF [Chloroflexi bacterium]|nr:NADH-quinone oxidoreductase subunit NuoF [Chloroflexota bacterium]